MYTEFEDLLRQATTKSQLFSVVHSLCGPHGTVVMTDVLCGETEPRQVMCMVQMADEDSAASVASRIGAMTYGMRMIVLRYPAPAGFSLQ